MLTEGTRVTINGVTTSGYQSFNGRTATVTKTYTTRSGPNNVLTDFVILDVDNYPWGFQTLASTVQPI